MSKFCVWTNINAGDKGGGKGGDKGGDKAVGALQRAKWLQVVPAEAKEELNNIEK